jgi:hypothetical protein
MDCRALQQEEDVMMTSKPVVALGLSLIAAGICPGAAQQKEGAGALSALDYAQIQQLYASYNRAVDFGDADGRDYAVLYVPDGVFVNVVPAKAGACQPSSSPWHSADRATIRGSIADRRGANMCVTTVTGSRDLATMMKDNHVTSALSSRHANSNVQITPTADGATGFAYLFQLRVSSTPATLSPTGFYEDALVKTATGWRFKRRIRTEDAVVNQPKP